MLNRLKYILLMIVLLASVQVKAQYLIDKVCQGAGRNYKVEGEAGSTYKWTVTDAGGNVTVLPETSDKLLDYHWNQSPGTYSLMVIQYSAAGCDSIQQGEIEVVEPPAAFAGKDDWICTGMDYTLLQASAGHYSTLRWTTAGDGTFSSDTILQPVYKPGPLDLANGSVALTLTADGQGNAGSCTPAVSSMVLHINKVTATISATPVSCYGLSDGTVTMTATGGSTPYTYILNASINGTGIYTGLAAGSYSYTVSDAVGCAQAGTVDVLSPDELLANAAPTAAGCNGTATGSIDLSISGGTTPYNIAWNNGSTAEDLLNIMAGTYSVNVTDSHGCTVSASAVVSESSELAVTGSPVNATCNGNSDGSIDITVTGGEKPYTFQWNTPGADATEDLANIPAGVYEVTVTDAIGCKASASFTIIEASAVQLTANAVNAGCFGTATGSITLSVTGGSMPYTYEWSNSETTASLANLTSGTYTVKVTDAVGCTASLAITLTETPQLVLNAVPADVLCNGGSTGTVNLTVTGGTPSYTYAWSNGAVTEDLAGLPAGTYTVTVTDAIGCTASQSAVVIQPEPLVLAEKHENAGCNGGADGSIDLTVTGGVPAYTYLWSNGMTTASVSSLTAGTYSVVVTDNSGCTATASIVITEASTLELADNKIDATCNGNSDGSIDLTVTGGTAPYTYLWNTPAADNTEDITFLPAGSYTVVVTDAIGCTAALTETIIEAGAVTVTETHVDAGCYQCSKGSITLSVTGGTQPYVYNWSNGAATATIDNLPAGSYFVTVTDTKGCWDTLTIVITQAPPPIPEAVATNVNCFGGADGSIDLSVTGGTAPYTYLWSNGQTTEDITALAAGDYTVEVTDSIGSKARLTVTVGQPDAIALQWANAYPGCKGGANGSISILVVGGTPDYTYLWSNGKKTKDIDGLTAGNYSVVVTDSHNCPVSFDFVVPDAEAIRLTAAIQHIICQGTPTGGIDLMVENANDPNIYEWSGPAGFTAATEDLAGLYKGTYTVKVTDAKGCTGSAQFEVKDAPLVKIQAEITEVACFGASTGSVELTVSGGKPPYSYLWQNGETTSSITGLPAGDYKVTVTDAAGCASDTIFTVGQKDLLVVTPVVTDISCAGEYDGKISLNVTGGTAPYSYQWTGGQTTREISGLPEGLYHVDVTDKFGCAASADTRVLEPDKLALSGMAFNTGCAGTAFGRINLTVSGGNAPYTYLWSNGEKTEDISNLAAGTYSVTVTDRNKCEAALSFTIEEVNTMVASINSKDISCFGAADGTANATFTGAALPVTYLWSNGATTASIGSLDPGNYTVRITDANGCYADASVVINEPAPLAIAETIIPASCNGGAGGAINLTVSGGTGPYAYIWSNGKQTQNITNLKANEYFVKVTDANGCFVEKTFIVPESAGLTLTETHSNPHCMQSDGSIDLTVLNGTAPLTFVWSNGAASEDISGIAAGKYTVNVTDARGCKGTLEVNLVNEAGFTLSAVPVNASCKGVDNGSIDLTVTSGTAPYIYMWSNGAVTQDLTGLAAGTYSVSVTDANGCIGTLSVTVGTDSGITLSETHVDASCSGIANGSIDLTVSGGTAPYSYLWNNGSTAEDLVNITEGLYKVSVTDVNGCTETLEVNLKSISEITAIATATSVKCNGGNDGTVTLTVTGGTQPYTFAWSNGEHMQNLAAVTKGTYSVAIMDVNGCNTVASATVTEPRALTLNLTSHVASCDASNGSITMIAAGGTPPYSYSIDGDNSWQPSAAFTGLAPGAYEARVMDANGCQVIYPAVVTIINVPGPTIIQPIDVTDAVEGQEPGTALITAQGVALPLQYSVDSITWQSDPAFGGLQANVYTAYVKDANGCIATLPFEVQRIVIGKIQLTSTSKEACLGVTIDVPVYATSGFTNITAFHVELAFAPKVLDMITVNQIHANLGGGSITWTESVPGTLSIDFTAPAGKLVSIPSDNLLFGIQFNSLAAGNGKLEWNEVNCTFTALGAYTVPTIYTIGSVEIMPMPKLQASGAGDYCENDPLTLTARTFDKDLTLEWTGPADATYTGESWPLGNLKVEQSGLYVVSAKNKALCQTDVPMQVNVHRIPNVVLPYDTLCLYRPILLNPNSGEADYVWTYNNSLVSYSSTYLAEQAGLYEVTVTSRYNCSASDKVYMDMCEIYIAVPNAFSPNGDGLNDTFQPYISQSEPTSFVMKIYNKWGQLLYTTNNYKNGWDGTVNGVMSKPDVYVYSIEYTVDAKVHSNMPSPINGTFTLVR